MANLLSNTTIGGYQSIHTGNIGSYAITSIPTSFSSITVTSSFNTASNDIYASMRVIRNDSAITDGMYIGYGNSGSGITRIFGGGSTGGALEKYATYTVEPGSFRAPIFYDSDNTTYYFDGNSTTSLRTRGSWRSDSSDWDGEYAGKIQYHSNHWYFQSGNLWLFRNAGGANVFQVDQSGNGTFNGDIYLGTRGTWLSSYLNQDVRTSASPSFASIYLNGTQLTGTQTQQLKNTLDITGLPYKCDIVINGDPDTFYPVHFIWGNQDVWRRIIINRGYSEQAPWDPIGTGAHHGGLLLDWEGNFGGWGGAEYSDRLRVFNQSYTDVCADMYIYTHSMGYVFMLRGGGTTGALYHIYSDQEIRGYNQVGTPDIAYNTSTLFYDHSIVGYRVYAPAPLTLAQINSSRIDGLRTKKQSLLDNRYLRQGVDISGIGTVTATNFLATNAFYLNSYNYYLNSSNGGIYTNARFETAGNLVVGGNSYLGNGNGDEVHINDILRVGATDSGDAHFYFGEGSLAGSDYGMHWYWDSGVNFYWYGRNAGSDTLIMNYTTNDNSYVKWHRHFHMNNYAIHYTGELHFNSNTRFVNNDANYLNFQVGSSSYGSIQVRDNSNSIRGYLGYFDSNGFGLLNSGGSWGIRLNPGSAETLLFYAGNEKFRTDGSGAYVTGRLDVSNYIYTPQHIIAKNIQGPWQVLNLDTIKEPGLYQYDGGIGGTQPLGTDWYNVKTIEIGSGGRYSQFVMPYQNNRIFYRSQVGSTWLSYVELISSENIGSQSVSYATTAGSLSSMNISQFTNNSGYLTSLPSHNHDDRYYTESESDSRYLILGGGWGADLTSNGWTRKVGYAADGGEWVLLSASGQISSLLDGSYFAGEQGGFYSMGNSNTYASRRGFYNDGTYANFNTPLKASSYVVPTGAYMEGYGSNSSRLGKVAIISFDWNSNYDEPYNHGIMSTNANADFADSISINSFNDITLRLDANNNNSESYLRIMNNTPGNSPIAYIGYDGGSSVAWFGGVVTAVSDFRAPIFYDSQDTGYYVDPNSLSNLYHTKIARLQGGKTAFNVLEISPGGTPSFIKIRTTIPFSYGSGAWSVYVKGFVYGNSKTLDLHISWHTDGSNNAFYSTAITSRGSYTPQVRLARESGNVVIVLTWGSYWPKLYVEAYNAFSNDYYFGWDWVDENVTGDKVSEPGVLYPGNFSDGNISNWNTAYNWGNHASAGYVTSSALSSYVPLSGTTLTEGNYFYFRSNMGAYLGATNSPSLQAFATGGNAAFMSFHRSGNYAVNFGLDADNVMRIGGWSAAADRWVLDMSGNNTVAGSFRAPIFYDSANTNFYGDFASTSVMNSIRFGTSTNNATLSGASTWGVTLTTDAGWIQFGPANGSWAHIYASQSFYFNQDLYVNGNVVITSATIGSQSVSYASTAGSADQIDGRGFVNTGSNNATYADSINSNGISYVAFNISLLGQTDGALYSQAYDSAWQHQIYGDYRTGQIVVRGKLNGTWQAWRTVIDSSTIGSQSVSYASTAGSLTSMNISQFTNNSGYLTGITSGQVTGALGYTPYNSSNPSGYITSSGSISGNAATATYATTAGSAPNGGNINQFYNVSAGVGNGLSFWNGSSAYKISMGVGSLYQYGPVSDYSIKMQMNDGDTGRGFTWGRESYAPIAALNSTSGDMEVAGYYKSYGYRGNGNVGGTGTASWHPDGIYCGSTMWQYGTMYKNNTGIYGVSEMQLNAGLYLQTYNDRNLIVKGNSSSDAGIEGRNSAGSNVFQIYGNGNDYGFLNGTWAAWDIRKTKNGALYMNDTSGYYLYTNGTSNFYALNIQGSAVVHAGNIGSQSVSNSNYINSTRDTPVSALQYWQAPGLGIDEAPSSDWYNTIRMGHGSPLSYYSNTLAIRMTGSGVGDIYTQTIMNGNRQGWKKHWNDGNHGSGSGLDADLLDGQQGSYYQPASSAITTSNIGSQSVSYASSAGSVAWTNVSSRPTALSQFTNDLGNYGGWQSASTAITTSNIGSQSVSYATTAGNADTVDGYHESDFWRNNQTRTIAVLNFTGVGGDSGNGFQPTNYGIYQQGGAWNHPYPDLCIGYHTGIKIGAYYGYNGTRFYNNSDWATEIFSVGNGDDHVRVANNLYVGGNLALHAGNYNSYSPTLTGTGASGTWGISISGNAATATNVAYSGLTGTVPTWNQNTTGNAATATYATTAGSAPANGGNSATVGGYTPSGSVGANTVVIRDANNYIYANYINSNVSETENPTINSFYTSNGDGWLRKSSVAHVKSQLGLGSMAYESSGTYQTVSGAINTGNIGSQSVSYATISQQLTKFGDIYGQDWNTYYVNGKMIVSSVYGGSGPNFPTGAYNYGAMLSYGVTGSEFFQVYFPENGALQGGAFRKLHYRTGWNGSWSAWKSVVDQEGQVCTIAGSNQTGIEIHSNVSYNQDPLTYFLMRGQADSSWKAFKVRLTGDAGGQDIEFRRIAENGTDSRMWYVPRGANTVNFEYPIVQPSDSRLKDNITPISTPVDKIKSLRGVEFDWNSGEQVGTHDVGLIAQDVEAVLPEAVTTQEDGYKNLAYAKVIPLLVEAMKEQQAMIDALKAEIELLKNK